MDIQELAKQAGVNLGGHPMNPLNVYFSDLKRFAELVAAAEREECAKIAISHIHACHGKSFGVGAAIRARRQA